MQKRSCEDPSARLRLAQDDRGCGKLAISSPHPTSLCSATFPQGKARRGRPLGRPEIKSSKEGVGEAFRLPRADAIRPYDEPKECNAKTMVRRSFGALRLLRMTGVVGDYQL